MKTIILFVLTFVSVNMYAQIPDTIYYQPFTFVETEESVGTSDSGLFIVYESKTLPNSQYKFNYPIDKAMTGQEVADYVFNIIYRAENMNWLDEARVRQRQKSNTLLPVINNIIKDFTGSGYFPYARNKFIGNIQGVYIVRNVNRTVEYLLIRPNGTVVECDDKGVVVDSGKKGSVQILTENRFRIISYFGEAPTLFNKELDTNFFFSDVARIRKLNISLSQN